MKVLDGKSGCNGMFLCHLLEEDGEPRSLVIRKDEDEYRVSTWRNTVERAEYL